MLTRRLTVSAFCWRVGSIVVCALSSVGSVSPELAALCRLRAAGKPEMTQLMKKGGVQRVDQIPSLNVINELHCVRGVRQVCAELSSTDDLSMS